MKSVEVSHSLALDFKVPVGRWSPTCWRQDQDSRGSRHV